MALPIGNVLGILSDNLRKRKSVLPLKASTATAWADGLDIPYGGDTVIYTGYMYQLIPSISSLAKRMADQVLSLPMGPHLQADQLDAIIAAGRKAVAIE